VTAIKKVKIVITKENIAQSIKILLFEQFNLDIKDVSIFNLEDFKFSSHTSFVKVNEICVCFSMSDSMTEVIGKAMVPSGFSKEETDSMYGELVKEMLNITVGHAIRNNLKENAQVSLSRTVCIKNVCDIFEGKVEQTRFQTNFGYIDFGLMENGEICNNYIK